MDWPDLLDVAGVTFGISLLVGGLGVVTLMLLRRASMLVQVCILVLTAIVSVVLSMVGVAQLMYLSPHDFTVAVNVAVISGAVSLMFAGILSFIVVRNSHALSQAARTIGEGEVVHSAGRQSSSELTALGAELMATSAKLAESREREKRIEDSRRELVAWIAHDLRTPLTGIMSMAEALEDDLVADPQRYYRQMRQQVTQLSAMVDDLFELSKIDSGTLRLSLQHVSLYDVVSDTVADLRPVAAGRQIRVESSLGGDIIVTADPRELGRAVSNLLLNAIQHTPPDSPILIAAAVVDGRATVSVIDSGGGIEEAELPRVFEPGWRGVPARTPQNHPMTSSGAGLGLAIVRGIVAAHRGDVTVQNIPGGCRFDVQLPSDALVSAGSPSA